MKKFLTLISVLFLGIMLTACGDKDNVMKIEFWHAFNGVNEAVMQELTDEFNARHEGEYQIILHGKGNYDALTETVQSAIKADAAPILVATYPDHVANYWQSGKVVELDEYIFDEEKGLDYEFTYTKYIRKSDGTFDTEQITTNYFEDILEIYRNESNGYANGKYMSLPLNKSTEVMYYNKSFFDNPCEYLYNNDKFKNDKNAEKLQACKIAIPEALKDGKNGLKVPETWDEVKDVAKVIKDITKGRRVTATIGSTQKTIDFPNGQYSFGYDSMANLFITLAHQSGGGYTRYDGGNIDFLFNNDTVINAIQMYKDMIDDGYAIMAKKIDASLKYLSDAFKNDLIFMNVGSSGGSNYADPQGKFEVGVAPIPQMNKDTHPAVIQQGTNISMLRNSDTTQEELDAAWEYIKFITSTEAISVFASKTAYLPTRQSAYDSEMYQIYINKRDPFTGAISIGGLTERVAFSQTNWFFVDPAFPGSTAVRNEAETQMENIILKNKSVREAIKDLYDNVRNK